MPNAWYQRLYLVLAVVLGSIYLLIPTFFWKVDDSTSAHAAVATPTPEPPRLVAPNSTNGALAMTTPPAIALTDAKKTPPNWMSFFPKRRLRLGLDLVGGSHLGLAVDTEETLRALANGHRREAKARLEKEGIAVEAVNQPLGTSELQVVTKNPADRAAVADVITKFVDQRMEEVRFREENGLGYSTFAFSSAWREDIENSAVEQVLELLRDRVNSFGVAEPNIFREQTNRIVVELPGLKDPAEAIENIKRTARLEFHIVDEDWYRKNGGQSQALLEAMVAEAFAGLPPDADDAALNQRLLGRIPEDSAVYFKRAPTDARTRQRARLEPMLLKREIALTGDRLTDANPMQDRFGGWNVSIRFDQEGGDKFAEVTDQNKGRRMAIVLEGAVETDPVIKDRIDGGQAQIELGGGRNIESQLKEASSISRVLKTGALPAPVRIVANRTVGPSLGQDAIRKGVNAAVVGTLLVFAFAFFWYRRSGLIAITSLLANGIILLGAMTLFDATLTLPGIAGVVLTIGMAVDANVLIYERIREELRQGRPIRTAVDAGFEKAFSSILDGNMTTAAAGLVLYWQGTDQIKGFAVTLLVGIATTLFTALVISRLLFDLWVIKYKPQELSI